MIVRAPTDLPDNLPFAYDDRLAAAEVDRFRRLFATAWQRLPRRVRKELLLSGDQPPNVLLSYRLRGVLPSGEPCNDAMGCFYASQFVVAVASKHMAGPDAVVLDTIAHEMAHAFLLRTEGKAACRDEGRVKRLVEQWGFAVALAAT